MDRERVRDRLIIEYRDSLACGYDKWIRRTRFYHSCIQSLYRSIIPAGSKVLEVGCATGELLSSLKPSCGVGIDISKNMVSIAKQKYPDLVFKYADIDTIAGEDFNTKFDYIIMSNLVDYLPDISNTLSKIGEFLDEGGLVVITTENPFWRPLMRLASSLKLRMPDIPRNFLTIKDLKNLGELTDFEIIKTGLKFFFPLKIPFLSTAINFIISEIPILHNMCLLEYIVMRRPKKREPLSCSVIIPCYNEADNIVECINRIPAMGKLTEIIVVDDGSTDDTKGKVEDVVRSNNKVTLISYAQNKGKGQAVKTGCDAATSDVVVILDADMSVVPEELPKFFEPLQNGKAAFANGTRMIYPMSGQAMRSLNYIGNKLFSLILSWLMEQYISDTLCGTKAFFKRDYLKLSMGRCKWGDFDLLFGIARLKKKIVEVPVHYQARVAGQSKMRVVKNALLLAKMCVVGFYELKLLRKNSPYEKGPL
ncbi:MAG: glycosyltransferase [Candidatus Omnitrophota bacterium]|nr:glycosyltransferase [Candidatus Omnitrophota bacterium]